MGKTRYLFKKIRYIKGTFHAKMGTIKGSNGRNRRDEEEVARIHRRTIQKDLNNQDNHDGVITPDILECKVK